MDGVSIRVPYRNLKQAEVELVAADEPRHGGDFDSRVPNGTSDPSSGPSHPPHSPRQGSLRTLILSCMVAAGVQFGWALQLSLLTPYIQVLFLFLSMISCNAMSIVLALWINFDIELL